MIAKLAFIAAHVGTHSTRLLCRVLDVSRSWFHSRQRTAPERAARTARHAALIEKMRSIFEDGKQSATVRPGSTPSCVTGATGACR